MFVVIVTFKIKPSETDAFLSKIMVNARLSLSLEPGCKQFDVCTLPTDPEEVFLYENYVDEAAFNTHKTMKHYLDFNTDATDMVVEKNVKTYHLNT